MKDFIKIVLLTILFSVVIFLVNYFFFTDTKTYIEEKYIEPSIDLEEKNSAIEQTNTIEEKKHDLEEIIKQEDSDLEIASKFYFVFIPSLFKEKSIDISKNISNTLENKVFNDKIEDLKIEFYEDRIDVRWKMKNRSVKLYDPIDMWETESLSVFIHELAHFIDLYFLKKQVNLDLSNNFYDISWQSTKVLRENQSNSDFVSGYAMTNKYEDFAESFTYFVLHNSDFLEKAKYWDKLNQKYNFFKNYLFKDWIFELTNFSVDDELKDYYRDTTKIDINLEKFLQFLEK